MTDSNTPWTALEERGTRRGTDAILDHVDALLNRDIAEHASFVELDINDKNRHGATPTRRRVSALLAAVAGFALVAGSLSVAALLVRGGDPDTPSATGVSTPPPAVTTSTPVATTDPGILLVPMTEWPQPAVESVVSLPQCDDALQQIGSIFEPWHAFLGTDAAVARPALVPIADVAAVMPVPRAGTSSLVTTEVLSGACTIAAADGGLMGWSLVAADGAVVMSAASVPMADNSMPDKVSDAPGDYQQSGIGTGQTFTGPVDEASGTFRIVTGHRTFDTGSVVYVGRLLAGRYDTSLIPPGYQHAGLLMNSLAMSLLDGNYLPPQPDIDSYALPTALPAGYGLCAVTYGFILHVDAGGQDGDYTQMVLCDGSGNEIVMSSPFDGSHTLPQAPGSAEAVEVNGNAASQWSDGDTISLRLERQGDRQGWTTLRIDAPKAVGDEVLRAIVGSTPLGSEAPSEPADAVALVGVGVGLPKDQEEFFIPDLLLNQDETGVTVFDRIAEGEYIDPSAMSESMQAILQNGLAGYAALPVAYMFRGEDSSYVYESALFDLPELGITISLGQQLHPAAARTGSALGPVEHTNGVWLMSTDTRGRGLRPERIQIVAYSPSIEREVNVVFGPRVRNAQGGVDPLAVDFDTALEIMHDILDSIAIPAD